MSETPKLSESSPIGFRPTAEMRKEINEVAAQTKRSISDIIRDGFWAYWPEIKALNYKLGRSATDAEIAQLRDYIDACKQAKQLGLDPCQVLTAAATAAVEQAV